MKNRKKGAVMADRWNKKLWPADIEAIRKRRQKQPPDLIETIAGDYGVSTTLVSRVSRDLSKNKVRNDKNP